MINAPTQPDISLAQTTLEQMGQIYGQSVNIHRYTRQLGQYYRNVFNRLDQQYQLSQPKDLNETCREIVAASGNNHSVRRVLNTIKAKRYKIEPETQLNVADLLCRTWALTNESYANAKAIVIDNLKHNIEARGGCLAGISARLIQPYSHFVQYRLAQFTAPVARPIVPEDEDALIEQAIALSLTTTSATSTQGSFDEGPTNVMGSMASDDEQLAALLSTSPIPAGVDTDDEDEAFQRTLLLSAHSSNNQCPPAASEDDDPDLALAIYLSIGNR